MNNLFIYTNTFLLMEFISTKAYKDNDFAVAVDISYNKYYSMFKDTIAKLIDMNIFKKEIKYKDIKEEQYDTIYMPSSVYPGTIDIIKETKYNDIVLLEEGMYDYFSGDLVKKEPKIFANRIKYLNNPNEGKHNDKYKEVRPIIIDGYTLTIIGKLFNEEIEALPDKIDLIVFTDPLDIDYNIDFMPELMNFLEENFEGKKILFKKHPRDLNTYESDKFESFYNSNLSGQLVNNIYLCDKLFTYPSTILLSSKDYRDTTILIFDNLLPDDNYKKLLKFKQIRKFRQYLI